MPSLPEPEFEELYRELILEHYRNPRNRRALASPDVAAEGYNPLCGDEVELHVTFDGDRVSEVGFQGRGCSISQASTSMLTEAILNKDVAEVRALIAAFKAMMTDPEGDPAEELGDLEALQGVARFPVRVKCATLAWHALEDGLDRREASASKRGVRAEVVE